MGEGTLTPEQVDNWRKTLSRMFGPMALYLSADEIQVLRNQMQDWADATAEWLQSQPDGADANSSNNGFSRHTKGITEVG